MLGNETDITIKWNIYAAFDRETGKFNGEFIIEPTGRNQTGNFFWWFSCGFGSHFNLSSLQSVVTGSLPPYKSICKPRWWIIDRFNSCQLPQRAIHPATRFDPRQLSIQIRAIGSHRWLNSPAIETVDFSPSIVTVFIGKRIKPSPETAHYQPISRPSAVPVAAAICNRRSTQFPLGTCTVIEYSAK